MEKIKKILQTKDKNLIKLYENLLFHLNFIKDIETLDEAKKSQERLFAFMNGYTEHDKHFKALRKSYVLFPTIHLNWIIEFVKFKIKYLQNPTILSMDDLLIYAKNKSVLGYFFLIVDSHAKDHFDTIMNIAQFDSLTRILLNIQDLNKNKQIHLPKNLINDYNLELAFDDTYVVNERFITLWQLLAVKVKEFAQSIKAHSEIFDGNLQRLLDYTLNDRLTKMSAYSKELIKKIDMV